jgi:[NiFe] hydrogenase diaphorase moiety small subunit
MSQTFTIDGRVIPFAEGQTILQAASAAGIFIPHLCYHPDFKPHGSCKLCTVKVNGRHTASCTMRAMAGMVVESDTGEINGERRALTQMLFVEGNHFCPSCEMSGNCQLQATAYHLGMMSPHYDHFFPNRAVDASHPDFLLDFNRCILCSLCVRASRDVDGKNVFALSGRGINDAPDRQCPIRSVGRYQFHGGRQGGAGLPGGGDSQKAPGLRRADR